jgi:NADP-dependent 3-hydroxy acid dehydrogenase YdfG
MGETKTSSWLGLGVALAALSAVFLSLPHPELNWDGDILPNAQRYMQQPTTNETPLKGMVIAITGATSGIGLELTRTLNKLGATVLAIGRSPEKLNALFQQEQSIQTVVADLNDLASVANASHYILEHYDHLDVLVNNAGIHSGMSGMWEGERPTTQQGYDVTFGGTYHTVGFDLHGVT